MKTIVAEIIENACDAIAGNPVFHGVIDGPPNDLEECTTPPRPPSPEWGKPELPFVFVTDVNERPDLGGVNASKNRLTVEAHCFANFRRANQRAETIGRSNVGELKATLMADMTRGGRCSLWLYGPNGWEIMPDGDTVHSWCTFESQYFHNLQDPTSTKIATSPGTM